MTSLVANNNKIRDLFKVKRQVKRERERERKVSEREKKKEREQDFKYLLTLILTGGHK